MPPSGSKLPDNAAAASSSALKTKDRSTTGKNTKASSSSTDAIITSAIPSPPTVAQTTEIEDHLYSKKTKTNYKGQVTRALAYAAAQTEPGWKDAFTKISSLTPTVLMAYVASKCQGQEGEGLSYKTAEGIKSGLKHYFKTELGCLTDSWTCDSDGNCTGNPVYEEAFERYLQSLKNRDGRAGTSRQSLAMTYSDMATLMEHLQDSVTIAERTEGFCLLFQAFAATGFTLWTRTEELTRLQMKDIELGLTTDTGSPYFTITLKFRKTNQADSSKANVYQIHPQPDYAPICCYTKLRAWLQWMERGGRKLHPEDYVFPALDAQGRIKFQEALSPTRVQGWLDLLTNQTGLLARRNGRFTTHCFRRGGAQFRFMFAKEKWSLKAVKWWGGWSEGEGTGTIMRYLLEEFTRYEYGFSDMMSPSRQDSRHAVFMGETDTPGTAPLTQHSLDVSLQTLKEAIYAEMTHRSSIQEREFNHKQEVTYKALMDSNRAVMASNKALQESLLAAIRGLGPAQRHQDLQGQQEQQAHRQCEPAPAPVSVLPVFPVLAPVPIPAPSPAEEQPQPRQEDVEPPRAPRIPTIKRWQDAVKQWEHGDPAKGLTIPLRDWTPAMRKTAPSNHSQRKLIAEEFNRVGRNEDNMNDIHGEHTKCMRYLIESIRLGNSRRKAEAASKGMAVKGVTVDDNEEVEVVEGEEEESEEECLILRVPAALRKQPVQQQQQRQQPMIELEKGRGRQQRERQDESVPPTANQAVPKPFKARVAIPRVTRSQNVASASVQTAAGHSTPAKRRPRSMSVSHTRAKRRW
ncbi:hypothetical protein BGW39_010989 [Mortierella sp. 14UC]|nr:hypothetical protein BGW39_010989 [Mortierella sp. 14UC]